MVQTGRSMQNIWVAASDGDLQRVQHLVEVEGVSPNAKDANSYSPMHAAASYAHLELLEYLLSKGGDINLGDEDGETPLFTVESVDFAREMIERGADPTRMNEDGLRADQTLEEDNPEISEYLRSLPAVAALLPALPSVPGGLNGEVAAELGAAAGTGPAAGGLSNLAMESYTNDRTSDLIAVSQRIMAEAQAEGLSEEETEERIRRAVEAAVREVTAYGQNIGAQQAGAVVEEEAGKRSRPENGGPDGQV